MNIGKALGYVFEDEKWVAKLGIAGGLLLLAIVAVFTVVVPLFVVVVLVGYTVAIVRNVRDGLPRPLPDWDALGDFFGDGLRISIAQLVWALPILVLYVPLFGLAVLMGWAGEGGDTPGILVLLSMCGNCFVGAYAIVLAALTPAIYVAYAEQGTITGALDAGRVLGLARDRFGDIIVILIVQFLVSLLAGFGLLLCLVGIVFTAAWATFVQGHLYGQLAARSRRDGPPAVRPEDWPPVPGVPEPTGAGTPEDIVSEVRERGEDALRTLDDTTVYVDEDPAWDAEDQSPPPPERDPFAGPS